MTYYEQNKEERLAYSRQYEIDHKKERAEYRRIHREHKNALQRKYDAKKRLKVLKIISNGNIVCTRCRCGDVRLFENNHINGV